MCFLGFTAFFTLGMWRAFSYAYDAQSYLQPRQKAEVVYRNLQMSEKFWTIQEGDYPKYEAELGDILGQNPFMNKKDKSWISAKIKETKRKSKQVVALRTVKK